MKCRWCAGTGEECGCGEGHCAHCDGSGETTTPPFGGGELRAVLSQDDVQALAEYWCDPKRDETLGDFIQRVAMRTADTMPSCLLRTSGSRLRLHRRMGRSF